MNIIFRREMIESVLVSIDSLEVTLLDGVKHIFSPLTGVTHDGLEWTGEENICVTFPLDCWRSTQPVDGGEGEGGELELEQESDETG